MNYLHGIEAKNLEMRGRQGTTVTYIELFWRDDDGTADRDTRVEVFHDVHGWGVDHRPAGISMGGIGSHGADLAQRRAAIYLIAADIAKLIDAGEPLKHIVELYGKSVESVGQYLDIV